jgi:hypothetical protein
VDGKAWQEQLNLLPVYSHRFAVCAPNPPVVLSIYGSDTIIYGDDLRTYLTKQLLP